MLMFPSCRRFARSIHSGTRFLGQGSFRPIFRAFSTLPEDEATTSTNTTSKTGPVRLSKLIASYATNVSMSRKEAERQIVTGNVTFAGELVTSPMKFIDPIDLSPGILKIKKKAVQFAADMNEPLEKEKTRVWVVHKLSGEIVGENDPHGRPSMIQRLMLGGVGRRGKSKKKRVHLKPVGRLDMSTEGLILVTNDGEYARQLELPKNQLHRSYRVRVHGLLSAYKLERLRRGLSIDGVRYKGMHVKHERLGRGTNHWITITCIEGKNRMLRKTLKYLGLTVTRLIRISYGDYHLQKLPAGLAVEFPPIPAEAHKRSGKVAKKKPAPKKERKDSEEDEGDASPIEWIKY